ncbi:MAG: hypothetical protein J5494_07135, partial [Candidatus Methanomethylophilaceae archaeon]|nr:hypothetical protein [Candidatus Methanomethylophilaceae archaeon]
MSVFDFAAFDYRLFLRIDVVRGADVDERNVFSVQSGVNSFGEVASDKSHLVIHFGRIVQEEKRFLRGEVRYSARKHHGFGLYLRDFIGHVYDSLLFYNR